jgi:sugar lactone lactonase YvrE
MVTRSKAPSVSSNARVFARAVCIGIALLGFIGCGANLNGPGILAAASGITGRVHGGQQPVANATVTLYLPGTIGYGSTGFPIAQATTDSSGNFTLPASGCDPNNPNLYITATGGDSGYGTNAYIALAAELGPCTGVNASTFIEINEVTTVVAAYTLAPFAVVAGTTTIGTSSNNSLGIRNAFGAASNLVNFSTGIANGANSNPNMVLPEAEINTLADIIAACVNSSGALTTTTGSVTTAAPCGTLITNATPPDVAPLFGLPPGDTFQAMLDIAGNPGDNVANLFALSNPQAPFQPTLSKAPGDFALAIQYIGGQISGSGFTTGMAIDSKGNAWVGNGVGNTSPKSVSKITPGGIFVSGSNGYLNGIAGGNGYSIDSSDNIFIAVAGVNSVYELNESGATVNTFSPASFVKPTGLAVDNRTGSFWTADSNNQPGDNDGNSDFEGTTVSYVKESTGMDAVSSPYGAQNGPFGVEIDGLGNIWVANTAANTTSSSNVGFLAKFTPPATAGNAYTEQTFDTGASTAPFEIAFDSSNNAWTTLLGSVAKFSNAGTLIGNYTAAANDVPTSIMIDGMGRAFISNATASDYSTSGSLTVFSPTGTLLSTANAGQGYMANNTINSQVFGPTGLAIDGSGNVWITGINNLASGYGFVTEVIGIAAPITTPTTVESSTNSYGVRP